MMRKIKTLERLPCNCRSAVFHCNLTDEFHLRQDFLTINDLICAKLHCGNQTNISSLFHQIVQRTAEGVLIKMVI